tara:strand:- start:68 stop:373 length:306 start_codon:yes stop_codon:yes gene_type:complete
MPSNKKNNYNFADTYFNFMEKNVSMNDINSIVIKHINIKEYEYREKRRKEALNIIPERNWKRSDNFKNYITVEKEKIPKKKEEKEKKIYNNRGRSVQYKNN